MVTSSLSPYPKPPVPVNQEEASKPGNRQSSAKGASARCTAIDRLQRPDSASFRASRCGLRRKRDEQPLTGIQGDVRQRHRAARAEPVIERETAQFDRLPAVVSQLNPIRCIALMSVTPLWAETSEMTNCAPAACAASKPVNASKVLSHCMEERYAVRGLDGRWESNFGNSQVCRVVTNDH